MKKNCLLLILFLSTILSVFAHPWKPNHFVVIDTDGGIDDFRAISMLLASPDVRVLGITVSPGVLSANETYDRVKALLSLYNHEGIPVGMNEVSEIKPAVFMAARDFSWGKALAIQTEKASAIDILNYLYKYTPDSIHIICLGSLNIIPKAEQKVAVFKEKTSDIIWSSNNFKKDECFNNYLDKEAFKKVSKMNIPLKMVDGNSARANAFNSKFNDSLKRIPVAYASEIKRSLELAHNNHYDEVIPLWMHFPEYFKTVEADKMRFLTLDSQIPEEKLQKSYLQIVAGETVNLNQVINFSWRKEDYFPDVQPIMDETVKKYGKSEWVAITMANELHRHLGVFAIIGTKMGIRAKEYFNAGIDEMKIVSYAGLVPPFSCMNDGLQVSTGATVGHGLISVAPVEEVKPVADFTYLGRTIRVTLKPEYGKKIASEVKELNVIHGLNSDIYWELIRKLAIKFWSNFDRHEIFTIEEVGKAF
jgi:pyrimidine-specific ribonucleoside hydrolase